MKYLSKFIFLSIWILFSSVTTLNAYNFSWSTHEDITKPCPGPGCEDKCKHKCGCLDNGWPKPCECEPSPTVCCIDNGGGGNGGGGNGDDKGSPVYLKSGFFTWSQTDISLISKPSLKLTRDYTAFDPHLGLFGNSWISGFERLFIKTVQYTKDNVDIRSAETFYILRQSDSSRFYYKYDEQNNAFIDMGKLQLIANKIDEHYTTLTYPNGMVETYEDGYLVERKDRNGNKLTLTYDTTHLLQSVQSGSATLDFTYNTNGFVSEVTDQTGRVWSYSYDENGNLIEVTDPAGGTKTYTYTSYKQSHDAYIAYLITDITDAEGKSIIHVSYDSQGRVSTYTEGTYTYTYNYINANTVSKTDNNGHTITYTLSNNGYITKVTDPTNSSVEEVYDDINRTSTTIDAGGNRWIKQFDVMGRTIASIDPLGNKTSYEYTGNNIQPSKVTSPLGYSTEYIYNQKLQLIQAIDSLGKIQNFTYDNYGHITKTSSGNNITSIAYNANGQYLAIVNPLNQKTTMTYNDLGKLTSITDAENRTIQYKYDLLGNIVKSTTGSSVVEYNYNKAGQLLSLKDPAGENTFFEYDIYRRLSKEIHPDGESNIYIYNSNNTLSEIQRRDGINIKYVYDEKKRPLEQKVGNDLIKYNYNLTGDVLSASNSSGMVSFKYNKLRKVINESQWGINIGNTYDADGFLKTISFLGQTISYNRNPVGMATNITMNNESIKLNYDDTGVLVAIDYPNQRSEKYIYDKMYNVISIESADIVLNYTYDNTGLILSKNNVDYTYDSLGRLTQAGTEFFNYDKAGNILNDNAQYNKKNNQFIQSDAYKFTYDILGNMKTKINTRTKEKITYTFNMRKELTKYQKIDENNNTIKILEFVYDAFGRRISKIEDGNIQKYLYHNDDIIAILDENNQIVATIAHDEMVDTPLSITNENGTFYYHRDHQGSIIALTDKNGQIVESFAYDNHYGTIVDHTKTIETNNPYAYTGREYDAEDLYYFRARYYDPKIKRFISEDPVGLLGGLNKYLYVGNNPVNRIDPSGLAWGNARAVVHFYTGGAAPVSLGQIGHYSTVSKKIEPLRKQWKQQMAKKAKSKAASLPCNTSGFLNDSDTADAYSGIFWIGGFTLSRKASCSVSLKCKDIKQCPPKTEKTYKFSCTLTYGMHDLFEDPSDFDNSGGTDFWDKWQYGGSPFYVNGSWSGTTSGGGRL